MYCRYSVHRRELMQRIGNATKQTFAVETDEKLTLLLDCIRNGCGCFFTVRTNSKHLKFYFITYSLSTDKRLNLLRVLNVRLKIMRIWKYLTEINSFNLLNYFNFINWTKYGQRKFMQKTQCSFDRKVFK